MTDRSKPITLTVALMFLAAFSVFFCIEVFHNVLLTFLAYYFVCCLGIPVVDALLSRKDLLLSVGFSKLTKGQLVLGVLHGLLIYGAMLLVFAFLKNSIDFSGVMSAVSAWGMPKSGKWAIFLIMVIFNGLVEEVFWRGYCLGKLSAVMDPAKAVVLTTAFYASYHMLTLFSFFGASVLGFIMVFTVFSAGLIWGAIRIFTKSLWAPAIGHMLATAGYMTIFIML